MCMKHVYAILHVTIIKICYTSIHTIIYNHNVYNHKVNSIQSYYLQSQGNDACFYLLYMYIFVFLYLFRGGSVILVASIGGYNPSEVVILY